MMRAMTACDVARFLALMDEWPQDAVDADPDEWVRADLLAGWFREQGYDVSATFLVQVLRQVLRACELFDAAEEATSSICPKCGGSVEDLDGFGVLIHDPCGYCSHPDSYGGHCRHCGATTS